MTLFKTRIFFLSVCLFLAATGSSQVKDSTSLTQDSTQISTASKTRAGSVDALLKKNKYLNLSSAPVAGPSEQRSGNGKEFLFYMLGIIILLFAFFKTFYNKYFNNIFRVFFNTSLRQNQLTDLLLQATLPSLIFNAFFVISTGLYTFLLLRYYHIIDSYSYFFIGLPILLIGLLYAGKFFVLKFIGWISGLSNAADQYIFVIFLINKIIGILLIPFIVLLAFAPAGWANAIIVSSFAALGILFLLRYMRSYSLLQNQLKINRFHFLLYILAIEILPFLVIYRLMVSTFSII